MSSFNLPSEGPVYFIHDDRFEVALYSHDGKKYRAVRELSGQTWEEAEKKEITSEHFYMLVACVERRKKGTRGLVGLG